METNERIDPLTGGKYVREKAMYIIYHGFNESEAEFVMSKITYSERDKTFRAIKLLKEILEQPKEEKE
jgi:hypothetical protein